MIFLCVHRFHTGAAVLNEVLIGCVTDCFSVYVVSSFSVIVQESTQTKTFYSVIYINIVSCVEFSCCLALPVLKVMKIYEKVGCCCNTSSPSVDFMNH